MDISEREERKKKINLQLINIKCGSLPFHIYGSFPFFLNKLKTVKVDIIL